jgi:hypothetical protein
MMLQLILIRSYNTNRLGPDAATAPNPEPA